MDKPEYPSERRSMHRLPDELGETLTVLDSWPKPKESWLPVWIIAGIGLAGWVVLGLHIPTRDSWLIRLAVCLFLAFVWAFSLGILAILDSVDSSTPDYIAMRKWLIAWAAPPALLGISCLLWGPL